MQKRKYNYRLLLTVSKYVFSLLLTLITFQTTGSKKYLLFSLLELAIIILLSELFVAKKRIVGLVFNDVLILIYNIQMAVLFFGNTYTSLVMLTNLDSLQALSGKALSYGLAVVSVFLFSFIPIQRFTQPESKFALKALSIGLAMELFATMLFGNMFSPIFAVYDLGAQKYEQVKLRNSISSAEDMTKDFRHAVGDYRAKSEDLGERPNVILILTEGLSQNIITDPRGITPNITALQNDSLNFTRYYNHTFATYRGIIGQLYSGYQLDNLDGNTLISLQDVFRDLQYHTAFINTEPINTQFADYLNKLNFDEIVGTADMPHSGIANSFSDKEAYELLFDTAIEKSNSNRPFFITIYTFGTHASFDSPDEVYGDGSNRFLNKFYNLDHQFGEFMKKFTASSLADNTIVVFTADHATYADNDYTNSFPNDNRYHSMVDQIPLFIYYKGITPETIDVEGRNSLDLAPTILDYLDIPAVNYFLGQSLFVQKQNNNTYDTVFEVEGTYLDTDGGTVSELSDIKREIIETQIRKYFIAKTQVPSE